MNLRSNNDAWQESEIVMPLDLLIGSWPVYMRVSQLNLPLKRVVITQET